MSSQQFSRPSSQTWQSLPTSSLTTTRSSFQIQSWRCTSSIFQTKISDSFKANFSDKIFCEPLARASPILNPLMIQARRTCLTQACKALRNTPSSAEGTSNSNWGVFNKVGTITITRLNLLTPWLLTSFLQTHQANHKSQTRVNSSRDSTPHPSTHRPVSVRQKKTRRSTRSKATSFGQRKNHTISINRIKQKVVENSIYSQKQTKTISSCRTKGTISMCLKNRELEDLALTIREIIRNSTTTLRANTPKKVSNSMDMAVTSRAPNHLTTTKSRGSSTI